MNRTGERGTRCNENRIPAPIGSNIEKNILIANQTIKDRARIGLVNRLVIRHIKGAELRIARVKRGNAHAARTLYAHPPRTGYAGNHQESKKKFCRFADETFAQSPAPDEVGKAMRPAKKRKMFHRKRIA